MVSSNTCESVPNDTFTKVFCVVNSSSTIFQSPNQIQIFGIVINPLSITKQCIPSTGRRLLVLVKFIVSSSSALKYTALSFGLNVLNLFINNVCMMIEKWERLIPHNKDELNIRLILLAFVQLLRQLFFANFYKAFIYVNLARFVDSNAFF